MAGRPKPKPAPAAASPPAVTPTKGLPHCGDCGHLPVCHRYGPCEYVEREDWIPSHGYFAKETPCGCKAWKDPA